MKKLLLLCLICTGLIFYGCSTGNQNSQGELIADSASAEVSSPSITKQVEIFGLHIYATDSVPDEILLHAANEMAEYLDNDEDGEPDNQKIMDALLEEKMAVVMTGTYAEFESMDRNSLPEGSAQDLYADETHPNGASEGIFDASLEEILHPITGIGWAKAYPEVFGLTAVSKLAKIMDKARGGHFEEVPETYPEGAWYTYYDKTCRYECQLVEYTYWALTSILGGQDFPGRLEEIQQEWRFTTREKVQTGDPDIYALLTDPQYNLPTVLPDGKYSAKTFEVGKYPPK